MATASPLPQPEEENKPGSQDTLTGAAAPPPGQNKPFVIGGRGSGSGGKDKTRMMLLIMVGVLVAGVAFFALISTKGSRKSSTGQDSVAKPNLGKVAPPAAAPGALVPQDAIAASQADTRTGTLEAKDIEKTKGNAPAGVGSPGWTAAGGNSAAATGVTPASASTRPLAATTGARNLGDIPPFKQPVYGDKTAPDWQPPAYTADGSGTTIPSGSGSSAPPSQAGRVDEQFTRPSMVFVAHESNNPEKNGSSLSVEPDNFGLQSGYHVAARLESMASTALHAPVTAVIEYNYERDGQLLIPAGARAVGKLSQADASGIVNITFESLELPGGRTVPISAIGATTSLQALKGTVTGKNAGKTLAIRALAGMGSTAAMMVGQSNVNGAISQGDLIRQRAADNIGTGADTQVMNLQTTEHIVVSVPAGTEIYLIFMKSQRVAPNTPQVIAVSRTQP